MKPIEPINLKELAKMGDIATITKLVVKQQELIEAHNQLLAKYESHHHHQDEDAMPGTTGEPQND